MTDHLRAALDAARLHVADGHSCDDTRGDCSDHMERVYRAALAADTDRPDAVPQPFAMARLGLYEPPTAEARPGLADVRQRVLVLQARWMLSEGDEADARCGAYDDVLDIIDHALTEKRP